MSMKKNAFFVVASLFLSFSAGAMSLNDLSILLPLPSSATEMSLLIKPQDSGPQGLIFSKKVFSQLLQLIPEVPNTITYRDSLKVIGIRIDPCFVEGEGPQRCRRQIRLVWQPVVTSSGSVTTRDAAVHSFYEFDDATFAQIWNAWGALSSGTSNDALQIHPRLREEGLAGNYWSHLKGLVMQYCGEKTLVRMTAMTVLNGEMMWIFAGFDVNQGNPKQMIIPRIQKNMQGVISSSSASGAFSGGMSPAPSADPEFDIFTQDSITTKKRFSEAQIKALMGKVHEYENPEKNNPGTLDCASCHLANMAHQWGRVNFSQWDWTAEFKNVTYQSSWNLNNVTQGPLRTNQLRAFGYFTNQPAISQRVINETAAAALNFNLN